jgi:hypothetical protein
MSTLRLLLLCILQRNIVISQVLRYVSLRDLEPLPRWNPFHTWSCQVSCQGFQLVGSITRWIPLIRRSTVTSEVCMYLTWGPYLEIGLHFYWCRHPTQIQGQSCAMQILRFSSWFGLSQMITSKVILLCGMLLLYSNENASLSSYCSSSPCR